MSRSEPDGRSDPAQPAAPAPAGAATGDGGGAAHDTAVDDRQPEVHRPTTPRSGTVGLVAALLSVVLLLVLKPSILAAVAIVAGLVVVVMAHEFGHFLTAKWAGMKVTEYFVGFGPRLWSFRRGETEYGVKAIPAGGYVKIIGMTTAEEIDPADEPRTYRRSPYGKRVIVVLAGIAVNLVLAYLCIAVTLLGQGMPTKTIAGVATVSADSPAQRAGVREGDRILAVDGEKVGTFEDVAPLIQPHAGERIVLTVRRNGEVLRIPVVPERVSAKDGSGRVGVSLTGGYRSVGLLEAVPRSGEAMWDGTVETVRVLGHFVSPAGVREIGDTVANPNGSGALSPEERPVSVIGIVDIGNQLVSGNPWMFFALMGAINLFLALFNLIPLLPFDGGHAAIAAYEGVASRLRGRRVVVDYRKLMPVTAVVFAALLMLGLSTMYMDIRTIFTGS